MPASISTLPPGKTHFEVKENTGLTRILFHPLKACVNYQNAIGCAIVETTVFSKNRIIKLKMSIFLAKNFFFSYSFLNGRIKEASFVKSTILLTPNLRMIFARWSSTVRTDRPNRLPISLLL